MYSTNERAPTMPNQVCFRHIEAIIPTKTPPIGPSEMPPELSPPFGFNASHSS